MKTETQTVQGKHIFSVDETKELTEKLLTSMTEEDEITAEMKQVAAQYKNRIAGKQLEITSCRTALNNGYEMRPFTCTVFKNFDTGYKEYHDVISGNLIAKEALTAADHQISMDEQLKHIEAEGAADQLGMVIEDKVTLADAGPSIFDEAIATQEDPLNLDNGSASPEVGDNVVPFNQIPREETFKPEEPVVEKPKRGAKSKSTPAVDPDLEPNLRESDFADPLTDGSRDDDEEDNSDFPW